MKTKTSLNHDTPPAAKPLLYAGGLMQKMWVLISKTGQIDYTTLSCYRKGAIKNFLQDTSMTWDECKKYGWRCIKVNVQFTACI